MPLTLSFRSTGLVLRAVGAVPERLVAWLDDDKIIDVCGALLDNEKTAKADRIKALTARAAALGRKREDDRAIADNDQAVNVDPKLGDAYYALGLAWARKGDHDQAIVDYDQAVGINPTYADVYSARARSWEAKGNPLRAEADRKKVLSLGAK